MTEVLNAALLLTNFVVAPSLIYGAQLALGALGVTLVFGVLRFSNFAHGDTMAFGTMVTILATWWMQAVGLSLHPLPTALAALPIGMAITVVFVLATDRVVYRYYREKNARPVILMMASLGVMFVTNGLTRLIIGADDRQFFDGARFLFTVRDIRDLTGLAEGVSLRSTQVVTIIVALLSFSLLALFLQRTRVGMAMRAYADNRTLAVLSGVRPQQVVMITWMLAASLAVCAGVLYGLDKSFKPFTYFQILLPIFAAAVVGGVGKPIGAVVGGFIVAFSEIALTYPYRKVVLYLFPDADLEGRLLQLVATDYKFAVSFTILVLVLLIRPSGIFRGTTL